MTQKALNYFMVCVMGLAFALVATVGYWLLAPYHILTNADGQLGLYAKEVPAGSNLEYGFSWCKQSDVEGVESNEFVDGIRYATPSVQPHYGHGCFAARTLIRVPNNLPPGKYKLHKSVTYQVNPLRWRTYEWWSPAFTVTTRKPWWDGE